MYKLLRLSALILLFILCACGKGRDEPASNAMPPLPAAAIYLSGAEVQVETPEQRQILHKALDDMLSLPGEDLRQVRYGPGQKTLREILRAHLVPAVQVPVTDDDFYNQISNVNVRKAVQSLNAQLTTEQ